MATAHYRNEVVRLKLKIAELSARDNSRGSSRIN